MQGSQVPPRPSGYQRPGGRQLPSVQWKSDPQSSILTLTPKHSISTALLTPRV